MYCDNSLINVELNGATLPCRCLTWHKNDRAFVLAGQCMEENRGFATRSTYLMIVSLTAIVAIYSLRPSVMQSVLREYVTEKHQQVDELFSIGGTRLTVFTEVRTAEEQLLLEVSCNIASFNIVPCLLQLTSRQIGSSRC
ncbi:hypothetical protein WN48_05896 [Eufriesea mexicana]|uniref:Uncharacterized protein n=1 Tax=Eufriesea mexicana TaxID=516756 RepID=A0A310SQ15_9HYME|nr:hypothetical protein WN48_05896 [Eufriesea mexicana]